MTLAFRSLTVPIDASPTARHGIDRAISFAGRETHLHFCSVVGVAGPSATAVTGALVDPMTMIVTLEENAERLCNEAEEAARAHGVEADSQVLIGDAADGIVRYAQENGSSAILICTHARTGLARVLAGSVTEGLFAETVVPVIVTHVDDDRTVKGPVTVAVDGSPASDAALESAFAVARAEKTSLSIVNVVASNDDMPAASAVLGAAAERARTAGCECELLTLRGDAAPAIVESAHKHGSRVIVMGTRGRSHVARWILGSVAAGVIEKANVPVVVVRAK